MLGILVTQRIKSKTVVPAVATIAISILSGYNPAVGEFVAAHSTEILGSLGTLFWVAREITTGKLSDKT